jgi:membrane-associated phospholipid phosphatase
VDWQLYEAIHDEAIEHAWIGAAFGHFEMWSVPVLAVATVGLWLLARPGGDRLWKLASVSALAASALALLVNQAIAKIWSRPRPYEAHHVGHIWVARSHDPSFPSDHASAAFAIAMAVFLFDRWVGSLFLAAAALIAGGRVIAGAHYPGDVLAGALVGIACALLVVKLGRPLLLSLIRLVERATDPLLRPLWR